MKKLSSIYDKAKERSDFGNGRFVRKIIEEAEMNLAERLLSLEESDITDVPLGYMTNQVPEQFQASYYQ